ncbi:MAG: PAS domain S-box protein [Acidobacteriia bacterium]|nr:PAS domain S-box protein [Terriglobia bacterium]
MEIAQTPHTGTDSRPGERALRQVSERFWSLFEAVGVGVVLAGPSAEIKECNQAALDLLGLTREQLVDRISFDPEWKAIWEDGSDCPGEEHPIPRVIAQRQRVRGEVIGVYRPKAQDWVWLLVNAEPRFAEDGSVIEVICSFTDITERKRALAVMTEWKNRYEAAMRASGQIFFDWNAVTNDITWSGDHDRILGYSAEELAGGLTRWMELVHAGDRRAVLEEVDRIITGKSPGSIEYRVRAKNGSYRLVSGRGYFYVDDAGQVTRMAGFISDSTERNRAEEELRASEERFRKAFAHAATGMTLQSLAGDYLEVNRAFCEITGYEERELLGLNYRSITHPDDLSRNLSGMEKLLTGKIPSLVMQKRYLSKAGRVVWVRNSVSLLRDSQGAPMHIIVLVEDITDRKQAEEALRASEERFRKMFAHAATGMTLQNLEGDFLEVNPAFCEITGYDPQELVGSNYRSITHAEDQQENAYRTEELLAGEIPSFVIEKRYVRKDGRPVWARTSVSLLGDSQPPRLITLVEDITERKRAEEALRQLSGRLLQLQDEERRRLARELHDGTAQTIAALGMNLDVVREAAAALDAPARRTLDESVALADQCIRELRTLSYILHPPMLDDRGLASALGGYVEGFAARSGIAVKLDLPPNLGRLPREVELMLFRIVQESLTNIHRHSGSRTATIRMARYPHDVVMEVRDQGNGIGTLERDGEQGARVGVGIAGMRERVRQIGGRLKIRSRPGGSDVEVVVPLSDPYR